MHQPWFRMYHEVLDDPKIQRLSGEMVKTWLNLLCLVCRNDGVLPELKDVAFGLRISEANAAVLIEQMIDAELFDVKGGKDKMIVPHGWENRQFKSDLSTIRVKRFRKRFRNTRGNGPEQSRTEQNPPKPPEGGFDRFWDLYPKRVGKQAAQTKWEKLQPSPELEAKIFAKIEQFKTSPQWQRENGQFIPHPVTWLNQGRWDDEVETVKTSSVHGFL